MLKCKYCSSDKICKCGFSKTNKQRYKCKECKKTFSCGNDNRIKHDITLRKFCVVSYLHGMSMSSIQSTLSIMFNKKIYFRNIEHWIKNADKILQEEIKEREKNKKPKTIEVLEMDELFVKKNTKLQKQKDTAIKEYGLLLTETEVKLLHLK